MAPKLEAHPLVTHGSTPQRLRRVRPLGRLLPRDHHAPAGKPERAEIPSTTSALKRQFHARFSARIPASTDERGPAPSTEDLGARAVAARALGALAHCLSSRLRANPFR